MADEIVELEDFALELAHSAGITLIAFLRDQGCNVYSHPERVRPGEGRREQ